MKKILLISVALLALSCTDADRAQYSALGDRATIQCFSGGIQIYTGTSTGKIKTENKSDGWYFEEEGSGKLIRISGDCIIRN